VSPTHNRGGRRRDVMPTSAMVDRHTEWADCTDSADVAVPMVCPWSPYRLLMTGSLRQRGPDTWELRVYLDVEQDSGRERWATKTVHGSQRNPARLDNPTKSYATRGQG
jgi:hypothetical protein